MAQDRTTVAAMSAGVEPSEFLAELLGLHARILLRMPIFQVALLAAIGWMALPSVPVWCFSSWAIVAIAVELSRMLSARWLLRRLPEAAGRAVYWRFVALDALAGVTLGVAALWFVPFMPLMRQVLFETTLVTVAVAGAAVTISGALMPEAYSSAVLLGVAISWALRAPEEAWTVGVLAVTCWCFLLLIGRESGRLLREASRIRHEKDAALASLERSEAQLRAAYARIRRGVDTRNRAMAAAGHDLRQPLHALSVYSAVLAAQPHNEIALTVGHNIEELVRDLGHILDEMLHMSSLSSGTYKLAPEPTDLRATVQGICDRFGDSAQAKGIRLDTRLLPAECTIDRVAFSRIVRNLIDNAIKFTAHGSVRVELRREGAGITLAVTDTGCGIAEADQQQVFDEFYQVDASQSPRHLGIGLGLAIVRKLCELTGGAMDLRSRVGTGSCFTVTWTENAESRVDAVTAARPPDRPTVAAAAHGGTRPACDAPNAA